MAVLEGEQVVQYVVDGAGRRQAALVRMDEWERILGWLDTGCFSWQAVSGLGELFAAGGDPEQAGWTEWASFRRKWLPHVDLGEEPSFRYAVRVRPAVLQETKRMTDDLRRRAIRLIDRLAVRPRQKRGFRLNLMPVEAGWEVRWCCVDNWHIIHAIEEDLHQEVVLTIFKRMPYPGIRSHHPLNSLSLRRNSAILSPHRNTYGQPDSDGSRRSSHHQRHHLPGTVQALRQRLRHHP